MKKFIALYYNTSGAHQPSPELTEEQQEQMMAPWGVWQSKYGDRVLDIGSSFAPATVSKNGKSWLPSTNLITGYSIVSATHLNEAQKMFEDHPIYLYPDHSVDISECVVI